MKVERINIKAAKGEPSTSVERAYLEEGRGIRGDSHYGKDGRITMLPLDVRNSLPSGGLCTERFVESITFSGACHLEPGERYRIGDAEIEIISIGKDCFPECPLLQSGEKCGLDSHAVFANITKSGFIEKGSIFFKLK